jgi:hypothetical protein
MWTTTYDMGIPGPDLGEAQKCGPRHMIWVFLVLAWDRHKNVARLNQLMGYCITGNFCGFGLKRRHLIFVELVFCRLKIFAPKFLFGITGSNN